MNLINTANQNLNKSKFALFFGAEKPGTIFILCKNEYKGECTRLIGQYKSTGFKIQFCEEMNEDFEMIILKFRNETQSQIYPN